jgi:hypothetical protein
VVGPRERISQHRQWGRQSQSARLDFHPRHPLANGVSVRREDP